MGIGASSASGVMLTVVNRLEQELGLAALTY